MQDATEKDVWAMLEEDAPAGCGAVQDLYSWTLNFDAGTGPFTLYLDLIGWSEDNLGETIYDLKSANLGYMELGKLAAALIEYADRPRDVRKYVDALMEAEARESRAKRGFGPVRVNRLLQGTLPHRGRIQRGRMGH